MVGERGWNLRRERMELEEREDGGIGGERRGTEGQEVRT